jgi:predicted nucleotidyltransferase
MKSIKRMAQLELGAFVQTHLRQKGIQVVLSGGASVSLYSNNKYLSKDLDLINVNFVKRGRIRQAMEEAV